MRPLQIDLSIFNEFAFEKPPVGYKFLFNKPEGIERLDKILSFCEMLKEAQQRGAPFYLDKENLNCGAGGLGMVEDSPPALRSGQLGVRLGTFQEPRAANRSYQHKTSLDKGTVNYIVLSPLNKLTFEPDLLMLTAAPKQAGIVLRAMSYSTGEIWESKGTPNSACTWLYVYPYQTGKVNYSVTGISWGMTTRHVFPDGLILISIPWVWIPIITQNLREMEWVPAAFTEGKEKYMARKRKIIDEIMQESQNA